MKKKNERKIGIVVMAFMALMVTSVFAVLALGIVGVSASGPTYVSGIISSDTTWIAADSPYIVTGNILVEEGVTLTIEPDVVVKFNSAKALQIDGELIAQGTEAEPIVFTSNNLTPAPGDWAGIEFTDSSVNATYDEAGNYVSGCIMQYCTVEYGGGSNTPAIKIVSSSLFIDHCNISNNAYCGIYIEEGSSKIFNSTISNNSGNGIYANESTVEISNCTIINNRGGIEKSATIYISGGTLIISESIINNNEYYGAIETHESTVNIKNNTINNNPSGYCGITYCGAVCLRKSDGTITNNSICGNSGIRGAGILIENRVVS